MNLTEAVDTKFELCTNAQLRAFCKEVGIPIGPRSAESTMRNALRQHFGQMAGFEAATNKNARKISSVLPPYNLILERGKWEGRRHVVMLQRPPGDSDKAAGRYFSVNAYEMLVPYDETVSVPEPILHAIRNCVTPRGKQVKIANEEGGYDTKTVVENTQTHTLDYKGVDPQTADRPGSLVEFYNSKGVAWFDDLTPAQIREICAYIGDIPMRDKQDRELDAENLRNRLKIYFFPDETAEAA